MNHPAAQTQELYSLLVPLEGERLIVPRACVAEVVTVNAPSKKEGLAPWFIGSMSWNGRMIPIVSFEGTCGRLPVEIDSRTRVVVFYCVTRALPEGHFGILTQGFPQLVRVNPSILATETNKGWSAESPIICQLHMINEYPLVPDLERLEIMIAGELGYARTAD